jgi:hypothetical protein
VVTGGEVADEDDMTLGELKRRKDDAAMLICGARALVHGLTSNQSYNEKVVTIENWVPTREMYEVRGVGMDAVLLVPRQNLSLIDDEDTSRDRITGERLHVHVRTLEDGLTRVVDGRHYRQTANGRWREVNKTFGDFFKQTSKRPEGVVRDMWNTIKRQGKVRQEKALLEMNRILAKNVIRLAEAADEDAKQEVQREQDKLVRRERMLRSRIATNESRKMELDELIEEERRNFLADEDEPAVEAPNTGGASASRGPAGGVMVHPLNTAAPSVLGAVRSRGVTELVAAAARKSNTKPNPQRTAPSKKGPKPCWCTYGRR